MCSAELLSTSESLLQAFRWLIAVALTYPVTFCCIFAAKLLVLDRMIDFTQPEQNDTVHHWRLFGRILLGIGSVGSIIGFCTNIAASAIFEQGAEEFLKARTSGDVFRSRQDALDKAQNGTKFFFGFLLFEAIMLLLAFGAFSVAGTISARRVHNALKSAASEIQSSLKISLTSLKSDKREGIDRAVTSGRRLKRQIIGTCAVVFFSFLLRAVFCTMMAVAVVGQVSSAHCEGSVGRCDACYNVYSHLLVYLLYTPQLFFSVVFISQPLALLVLLWGMTSGHTLAVMKAASL